MPTPIDIMTRRMAACDEAAWREFHELYYPILTRLSLARRVHECEIPERIQGVYLRVMRHIRPFESSESFTAWLTCLLRCEITDAARKRGRRHWLNERFQQWYELRKAEPAPFATSELHDAIQQLTLADQILIRAHYLDGWSQEALAAQRQTTTKAIESKLARLRNRIRQILEKEPDSPL